MQNLTTYVHLRVYALELQQKLGLWATCSIQIKFVLVKLYLTGLVKFFSFVSFKSFVTSFSVV